ncbi:MAG: hypothetical protein DRH08_05670 [Deltaproteobacteria bacterium]|nr:MAG: hypothetical protein DRH08_05670 [Deltaproteobacteria bacterium]
MKNLNKSLKVLDIVADMSNMSNMNTNTNTESAKVVYYNVGTKYHSVQSCSPRRYRNQRIVVTAEMFTRLDKCQKGTCLNHAYETTTEEPTP